MRPSQFSTVRLLTVGFLLSPALAACDGSAAGAARGPVAPGEAVALRPSSAMAQAQTGLSQLPRPRDVRAFNNSIDRHYPANLRAERRRGSVLVDITIDERGHVRDVRPVSEDEIANIPNGNAHRAVLLQEDPKTGVTTEVVMDTKQDLAFVPAARKALREVTFSPAVRNGEPVAYTLRMSIYFSPPST